MNNLTYTYKDKDGNKYQPYQGPDDSLNDGEIQQQHTCGDCGTTHLLKDCPTRKKIPLEITGEGQDATKPQELNSPRSSTHSSSKASSKSPPRSPQKRQILPSSTTNLLKSQVIELQADNAKLEQARGASMQFPVREEQHQHASSETTRQEEVKDFHKSNSIEDSVDNIGKDPRQRPSGI